MKQYVVTTTVRAYINAEDEQSALDKYNHQYENSLDVVAEEYNQEVYETS